MCFTLYLLDEKKEKDSKTKSNQAASFGVNINKVKRLNLSKIDKILKENETLNLFGDMNVSPFGSYIKKTANYDASKWPECNSSRLSAQGLLLERMRAYRCVPSFELK